MKVAVCLATALSLGASTFAAAATYNMADKGAYTLFDQPLSSEAPPSTVFKPDAGLANWLPPRFLQPGTVGTKAIPTNNWWGNMIAFSTDSVVQPVWTNPYALRPILNSAPYGLAVSNPYASRTFGGSTGNGGANQYYFHTVSNDVILSATSFNSTPDYQVTGWDDLGVTVAFYQSPSAKMESTLVPGMAFATAKYTALTPTIVTGNNVTSINGGSVAVGASVTGSRFVLLFSNKQKWVLYTSTSTTFKLSDSKTLTASAVGGTVRLALVASDAQLAVLDSNANCFLEGSDVEASSASSYMFRLKTSGDCSKGLFHYLQVHHVDTLDTSSASAVANAGVNSATRGLMTGVLTKTNPPVIKFNENQGVPVDYYPPRKPSASIVADQKIKETLMAELNGTWDVPTNGSYYFNGKNVHKLANLCLVANDEVVTGSDKSALLRSCLDKLETALAPFLSNSWDYPLRYDTTYRGIISSLGLKDRNTNADFGNTMYNDHHYHYGYWIATAAIVNYLDPSWSQIKQLNMVTMFLIRDVANPSNSDTNFPRFRQFDWFRGHSYSHGVTAIQDGKDQESSSEDINFHYAVALFGKATGNSALAITGQLLLKLNTRAVQTYYLMASDNRVHPASFVPNKVPGILFDNKADYTTWFSSDKYAIHGIQMIPITAVTEYVRTATFVKEEWDAVLSKIPDVVTTNYNNAWLSLFYANYATVDANEAIKKLQSVAMDDGLSRTWALYIAATRPGTPVAPAGGQCGTEQSGPFLCPSGQYCQPWDPFYYQCRSVPATCGAQLVNTDFYGDDITSVQVDLPELCCDQCLKTANCTSYTFRNYKTDGKGYCYLKKGTGNRVVSIGAVSAVVVQTSTPAPTTVTPAPTTVTPAPTTVTPAPTTVTPAPTTVTPAPTTVTPAPTTVTPAPTTVTPAPTTVTPAPATVTPAPTTVTPAPTTVTPAPMTVTPAPTTVTPAPTIPAPTTLGPSTSGAACGNEKTGPGSCASGAYCQPWDPNYYQCRTLPALCGVQQVNVDFYGDDISSLQVLLPEQCCEKCRMTAGCTSYTFRNYNSDGKAYCYLKKGTGNPVVSIGAISAVVVATTTPAPTTPTPAPTTPAPAVAGGPCGNQQSGPSLCPSGSYCQPWYPYYYQCRTLPATCGTQQVNVDFYGDDISSLQVVLPEECCEKCRTTAGCTSYTFRNYNSDGKAYCYLKKGTGNPVVSIGAISAVIASSSQPSCANTANSQCGTELSGPSCCPSGYYCQPWNPLYYQCVPSPQQCGAQQIGIDFYGNDIKTVEGLWPADCCSTCANTVGCVAYTYVNANSNGSSACYLKSGTGTRKAAPGAVSSTVLSPKQKCSYTLNTDFYGNDLASATGLTVEQCCDKCASTSRCSAFTYASSVCYMKTSSGSSKSLSGATSGVVN